MPTRPQTHFQKYLKARLPTRTSDERRGSAAERGYDYDWQQFREQFLREHPVCCFAEHPRHRHECTIAASVVDHIKPLSQGGARLDPSNCRAVCRRAHEVITENLKRTGRNELPPREALPFGGWGPGPAEVNQ